MKTTKEFALEKCRQGLDFISAYKFGEPEYQIGRLVLLKGLPDARRCMEEETQLSFKSWPVYLFSILPLSSCFIPWAYVWALLA